VEDTNNRIPRTLPVLHMSSVVMFPYLLMPLVVSDEESKLVIDYALSNDKLMAFFLDLPKEDSDETELVKIGTAVTILRMLRNQDGSISLLLQGSSRIKQQKMVQKKPFIMVDVEQVEEFSTDDTEIQAYRTIALELLEKISQESSLLNREMITGLGNIKQAGRVADIIAGNIDLSVEDRQQILELVNVKLRYKYLNNCLAELIRQMRVENHIRSNIQLEMNEDQRRYYLREQLDAIRRELGETDEVSKEMLKWRGLIEKNKLPEHVKEVAYEELERLGTMQPAASEYGVIRNYLDWIVNLPWKTYSKDRLDLKKIERILATDHYGLEKAKERIIEYIAVKKLKGHLKGPILCFVGPPGTGKTSIGRSVARALNRKFIRISLGGIHDEAEIRGHRRTYIGAMPGKILMEIKRQGTANPVFMLDEIDKLGRDFRGDPASALLEVLDPEQNNSFVDNYINLAFDLSEVMFITTANSLDTIPPPLRDRMEMLEFSGYIEEEKLNIAKTFLIPKQVKEHGLTQTKIEFDDKGIRKIIAHYTREAGVRNLEREIANICRKVARDVAGRKRQRSYIIDEKAVDTYLGPQRFFVDIAERASKPGVSIGLAWTAVGGDILFIEATGMKGKGNLHLTGQLGDVMKESAEAALSYIRSNAKELDIDEKIFSETDIHVHVPAGAVQKDGPSAGVTILTAIYSLLKKKKVKDKLAMTGEITLRGTVLPVGGIKEKVLAAHRAGLRRVILPDHNRKDLVEIPKQIKKEMNFEFVKEMSEVLDLAVWK